MQVFSAVAENVGLFRNGGAPVSPFLTHWGPVPAGPLPIEISNHNQNLSARTSILIIIS